MATNSSGNYLVAEGQLLAEQVLLPCLHLRSSLTITLQARREKAKRLQDAGEPIQLPGKALDVKIEGNYAWIAENTTVVKKLDLEVSLRSSRVLYPLIEMWLPLDQSGKVTQVYKGHAGPVTSLAFYNHDGKSILASGSWDKVRSCTRVIKY